MSGAVRFRVLSGILLAMFVSMLSNTIVATSLPTIVADLGGDQVFYTWVVTASLLTMTVSTPAWGKLADMVSRKILIQLAIGLFAIGSSVAGIAPDPTVLIACRLVQGIGSGGLLALSQIILTDLIPPRQRGKYMGLFGAVMTVATTSGPIVGGIITDALGWRWTFFVVVPFAVGALVILQRTLHLPPRHGRRTRFDYLGGVLLAAWATIVLVWVTLAGNHFPWAGPVSLLFIGAGILTGVLTIIVELRVENPLLPLTLFAQRTFALAVIANMGVGAMLFGGSIYLNQYMQLARGATPTESGLLTLPLVAGMLIASVVIGGIVSRTGSWKPLLITAALAMFTGIIALTTVTRDTPYAFLASSMALLGIGMGTLAQHVMLIVQNSAPSAVMGVTSSSVTFFRSLSGAIGLSAMGTALATRVSTVVADSDELSAALASLGEHGRVLERELSAGVIPHVDELPSLVRHLVEAAYASGVGAAFLVMAPFGLLTVAAMVFMPPKKLATELSPPPGDGAPPAPAAGVS